MNENLELQTERVDDLPLLLAQATRMQVRTLLNQHFLPHANWQGADLGLISEIWLSYIVSQADHRLNQLQPWVTQRLNSLQKLCGESLVELDFSDDRLASVLDYLSSDKHWYSFEAALTQNLLRVYQLRPSLVRLDSTTVSRYGSVSEDGLFQFGHSKDHRPDLPQLKVQLATLDPLGLPLSTTIVSGERADDGLYLPEIKKVQATVAQHGLLYVGDCKMAALAIRAYLAHTQDYYLCPLPLVQFSRAELAQLLSEVGAANQTLREIYPQKGPTVTTEEVAARLGVGFEITCRRTSLVAEETVSWTERLLIVRSDKLTQTEQRSLEQRLQKAQVELEALNSRKRGKRVWAALSQLEAAAGAILKRYKLAELIELSYEVEEQQRQVRAYGKRPAQTVVEQRYGVVFKVNSEAVEQARRVLGWRVYVTNQTGVDLSLEEAVWAYRHEYLIEQGFGRLKGRSLSLTPMYLADEGRIKGLIRLLSIGLRVLSLVEYQVRQALTKAADSLSGLYAGQPKRTTSRPTTEKLLGAFNGIFLTKIIVAQVVHYHLTPLTALQQKILNLLDFPETLYTDLTAESGKLTLNMSEP